jgi:DNA-binding transcriptional ArsR family regulator
MIDEMSALFLALADGSRLKILRALLETGKPLSQGALAAATGLSQANASKHLARLVQVGLVLKEAEGNTVFYRPVMPLVEELCDRVCSHVTKRVKAAYQALR